MVLDKKSIARQKGRPNQARPSMDPKKLSWNLERKL
jgi:hypothetical protein